ncbi:hypothetical protein FZJ97_09250 [Campylobacter coli]|nr:hypothetical protein [Campylobacter coli]
MKMPQELLIEAINDTFVNNKIYLFKNKKYEPNSPSHFHIALKTQDDNYIILLIITSKVEKKKEYYAKLGETIFKGLIEVSSKDISILTKESCIDCNVPLYYSKEEIKALAEDFTIITNFSIKQDLKRVLINAIKESPLVKPIIANAL